MLTLSGGKPGNENGGGCRRGRVLYCLGAPSAGWALAEQGGMGGERFWVFN